MKFLMKRYEHRNYPMGDVYRIFVESFEELKQLFHSAEREDGKRSGSACFKKEGDSIWLEYEEFVMRYFSSELRFKEFEIGHNMVLIGLEDEQGKYKSYEQSVEDSEELRKILEGFKESGAVLLFEDEYYPTHDPSATGETAFTFEDFVVEKARLVYKKRLESTQGVNEMMPDF